MEGTEHNIMLYGALAPTGTFVRILSTKEIKSTPKALELVVETPGRAMGKTFWLPKRAISKKGRIASWFRPDKYVQWIFDSVIGSGVSV